MLHFKITTLFEIKFTASTPKSRNYCTIWYWIHSFYSEITEFTSN